MTGADGFLGAHLVAALAASGATVHALVRPEKPIRRLGVRIGKASPDAPPPIVDAVDVEDLPTLRALLDRIEPDWLFHVAATGGYRRARDRDHVFRTNVVGAHNVLEASAKGVGRIVFTGGSSEYGSKMKPLRECDRVEPISHYAVTKAAATLLFEQAAREGRDITILRPFSIYGPAESPERLVPTAIRAALEGQPLPLTREPFARDFVFVEDVAEACITAAKRSTAGGEIFNIGTGVQTTNHEIVDRVEAIVGRPIKREFGAYPAHPTDSLHWVADLTRAREGLGFEARHSLDAGLTATLSWFRRNSDWR